jgi:hypothetical protein
MTAVAGTVHAQNFVNFDDPSIGNLQPVTTQYAAEGVVFSGVTWDGQTVALDANQQDDPFDDVNPPSAPNALSDYYGGDPEARAEIMQIDFLAPASDISFLYNPAGDAGVDTVFNVYNTSDVLIDSFSDPNASGDGVYYTETIDMSGVGEVDIVAPEQGWGHYIDNLTFTESASAPDGGMTIALLGGAFAALAAMRRKIS